MRTISMSTYHHSTILTCLNRRGLAKPVGPAKANEPLQWVRTWGDKVIYIGLILRDGVKL